MHKTLVTVGTDGLTDWVRLSNGSKMSLGSISVLSFISKLTASTNEAKRALNGFLGGQEVLITVDENRMWDLLAPKRSRWSSLNSSFMPPDQQPPSIRITNMTDKTALLKLNQHIEDLTKYAHKASPEKMAEGVSILCKLASKVTAADASEEEDAKDDEEGEEKEQAKEASVAQKLSYDTVVENKALVTDILAKAEATVEKIDKLASEGRKFNASRAKADLHAVTSKVAGILRCAELTEKWVNPDLQTLSKQVDHIHGLFNSAK